MNRLGHKQYNCCDVGVMGLEDTTAVSKVTVLLKTSDGCDDVSAMCSPNKGALEAAIDDSCETSTRNSAASILY